VNEKKLVEFRGRVIDLPDLTVSAEELLDDVDWQELDPETTEGEQLDVELEFYYQELENDLGQGISVQHRFDCLWEMPASDNLDPGALRDLLALLGADARVDADEFMVWLEQRDAMLGVLMDAGYVAKSELRPMRDLEHLRQQ